MTRTRAALVMLCALHVAACSKMPQSEPAAAAPARDTAPLATERERISYTVGLDMARTLPAVRDEVDIDTVVAAIRAAHAGKQPALTAAQADAARAQLVARLRGRHDAQQRRLYAANARAAEAFLERNARAPGVEVTASGLQYRVERLGSGPRPGAGDTVRLHYVGKRLDGSTFESSYAIDHPAELVLSQVMPGLREAATLMPAGSRYVVWMPPALAYGVQGVPGTIEPGSALRFDIELLEVAARSAQ